MDGAAVADPGRCCDERLEILDGIKSGNRADYQIAGSRANPLSHLLPRRAIGHRSDIDTVVNHAYAIGGKSLLDQVLPKVARNRQDIAGDATQQAISDLPWRRRPHVGEPAVLGEHDVGGPSPQSPERAVHER